MPVFAISSGLTFNGVNNERVVTDGIKTSFETIFTFVPGSLEVSVNGQELYSGEGGQFIEGEDLKSFALTYEMFVLKEDDILVIDYLRVA